MEGQVPRPEVPEVFPSRAAAFARAGEHGRNRVETGECPPDPDVCTLLPNLRAALAVVPVSPGHTASQHLWRLQPIVDGDIVDPPH